MFDDDVLEKIFANPEVNDIPIENQSTMIKVIEKTLEEMGVYDATLSKS